MNAAIIDSVGARAHLHLDSALLRPMLDLFDIRAVAPVIRGSRIDRNQNPWRAEIGCHDESAIFREPSVAKVAQQVMAVEIAARLRAGRVDVAAGMGAAMHAPLVKGLKPGDFTQVAAQGAFAAFTLGMGGLSHKTALAMDA